MFFHDWTFFTISATLLVLVLFEKYTKIRLPTSFIVIYTVFIIASLVLGSGHDFYEKIPWWDDLLHFSYGIGFSVVGYLVIQYFSIKRHIENGLLLVMLFSICFTLAGAVIWEIYEFTIDSAFGWNTQSWQESSRGVNDTMHDLIYALVAAIFVNVYIYAFHRLGVKNWIADISRDFFRLNTDEDSLLRGFRKNFRNRIAKVINKK